jgi:hypothetical protein
VKALGIYAERIAAEDGKISEKAGKLLKRNGCGYFRTTANWRKVMHLS